MKETSPAKETLMRALREIGNDNAMSEARFHIRAALRKMEQVEHKRLRREAERRQTQFQQWRDTVEGSLNNPLGADQTLDALERMIEVEQAKIDEIRSKKAQGTGGKEQGSFELPDGLDLFG